MRLASGAMAVTIFVATRLSRCVSGDDVGQQLVFAPADFVAQPQLAFLQPRERQLVGDSLLAQRDDGLIKVAMLDPQDFQAPGDFFVAHRRPSATLTVRPQP